MKFTPTIPNFLTIFRVVLIPAILAFIWMDNFWAILFAILLYGLSAITDTFDGFLARKLNQTSEFGAYFDPLADKFLVWSLFTVFSLHPGLHIPVWLILFIYIRDFFITFMRSYTKKKGIPFKTSFVAKAKTFFQMVSALLILIYMLITRYLTMKHGWAGLSYDQVWGNVAPSASGWISLIPLILTVLTVIFTLYTALDYVLVLFRKDGASHEKNRA